MTPDCLFLTQLHDGMIRLIGADAERQLQEDDSSCVDHQRSGLANFGEAVAPLPCLDRDGVSRTSPKGPGDNGERGRFSKPVPTECNRKPLERQTSAKAEHGLLLAVSGGSDSMAMLHGIQELSDTIGISRLAVAHFNHGLRGDESDADALLVEQTCGRLGIGYYSETSLPNTLRQDSRGSLEEAARKARYEFLARSAMTLQTTSIATAHHQQDQTETVLFSLLRGTGLRGLTGIPEQRRLINGIQIIRPMLHIKRTLVWDYVQRRNIAFREDSSNAKAAFTRNQIRMLLASMPAASRRELEDGLLDVSRQANRTMSEIDRVSDLILTRSRIETTSRLIRLDRRQLALWPEPLVRHALILQWHRQQWPRQQMNSAQWHRLATAALSGVPRRWTFAGGIQLIIKRGQLQLECASAGSHNEVSAGIRD